MRHPECGCHLALDYWKEIRARYFLEYVSLIDLHEAGKAVNRTVLAELRERSAREAGKRLAAAERSRSAAGLWERFWSLMPGAVMRGSGRHWAVEADHHLLADAMAEIGVQPAALPDWADLLETEVHSLSAFWPGIHVRQTRSHFRGHAKSGWELTLPTDDESLAPGEYTAVSMCESCPIRTWAYVSARYFTDLISLAESLEANPDQNARQLAYDLRWESAVQQGRRTAERTGDADLDGLNRHYWSRFPNIRVEEHVRTPDMERMVCRADSCNFCQGFQMIGLEGEQLSAVGKLACIPDEAFIYGLIPNVAFEMPTNQMQGDSHCTWVLTVNRRPGRDAGSAE